MTTADTFGDAYVQQLDVIYKFFNCKAVVAQQANCSAEELAQLQWRSSDVTFKIYPEYEGKSAKYLRKS